MVSSNTTNNNSRWSSNPKLINIPKTPLNLSGIILELLRDNFTYNSQIFKYVPNEIESRLVIDLHQQWNPTNCENYPGVYVKRNEWRLFQEGRVLGNYKQFLMKDNPYGYEFWVPISASYSIICVGNEYGELEGLLNETFLFFTCYTEPIKNSFDFKRFDVVGLSPVNIYKEEKNIRIGQVDLSISFDFIWTLNVEKSVIKDASIKETNNGI